MESYGMTMTLDDKDADEISRRFTQSLAQSMQNTKDVMAGNILRKAMSPKYKIHMHMKKDWRILELRKRDGRHGYYTHSSYKTHREAQAIMKLLEE